MHPIKFEYSNITFGEGQKEYLPLPAYRSDDGLVVTCWKLSILERLKIVLTGRIYLNTLTFNMPLQPQKLTQYFEV